MIYIDINGIPEIYGDEGKMNWGELLAVFKEHGVWLYDSTKGNTPYQSIDDEEIVVYDINSREGIKFMEEHNLNTDETNT